MSDAFVGPAAVGFSPAGAAPVALVGGVDLPSTPSAVLARRLSGSGGGVRSLDRWLLGEGERRPRCEKMAERPWRWWSAGLVEAEVLVGVAVPGELEPGGVDRFLPGTMGLMGIGVMALGFFGALASHWTWNQHDLSRLTVRRERRTGCRSASSTVRRF